MCLCVCLDEEEEDECCCDLERRVNPRQLQSSQLEVRRLEEIVKR